jgi:uncharacterized membrane-anchored protein
MIRKTVVLIGLAIILVAVNWSIVQKERLLHTGTSMLLQLAPVDPRSLIQGDYMRLDYAIAREVSYRDGWASDGQIVVANDADGVARFVRLHDGTPLAAHEHLLRYRNRDGRVRIGTDAFFFQEGTADRYAAARYGELHVDDAGEGLLIGLRGAAREPLGGDEPPQPPASPPEPR